MENASKSLNQSLNLYSIFGYLLPGFFLTTLVIIDYDFSKIIRYYSAHNSLNLSNLKSMDLKINYILDFFSTGTMSDFKFIPFLIFLFYCYLLVHLVSAFSSFLLERFLLKITMGFPSETLLSGVEPKCKLLFGNYRRPFKKEMVEKLEKKINSTFCYQVHKSDYYWLCYSNIIVRSPYLAPRVHHFVNLYGFSRNITASIIIYLIFRLLIFNLVLGSRMDLYSWLIWSSYLAAGSFMFWNYLKLFKRQAIDTFYLFLSIKNSEE